MIAPNLNPEPRTLKSLLPTPRDFDIHRCCAIEHISTRTLAEKHGISQTRVRQVIQRVNNWLAETLPAKTEAQQEQETRLAKHLAAEQLRHQIAQLKACFDGTGDLKYLRQQTRTITALARLGTIPGQIESLAADAVEGPYDPAEPQPPWSEDDPWANAKVVRSGPDPTEPGEALHSRSTPPNDSASGPVSPSPTLPLSNSPPPPGDCSPSNSNGQSNIAEPNNQPALTPRNQTLSSHTVAFFQEEIEGLNILEQRLLTQNQSDRFREPDEIDNYQRNLADIRRERAFLELQLSPNAPGAKLADLSPAPITPLQQTPSH